VEQVIAIDDADQILAFSAYISVDGDKLSAPGKVRAQNLFRPTGGSLDHHVTWDIVGVDQGFLTIKHYAFGIKLSKPSVGETRIFIKDMQDIKLKVITDKTELMFNIKKYCENIEQPSVEGAVLIEFTANNVDHNMNWMAKKELDATQTHAKHALKKLASKVLGNKPLHFRMLVLQANKSDFAAHVNTLQGWEKGVSSLKKLLNEMNPLDVFFNKPIHDMKTLPLSAMPNVDAFPGLGTLPRHTRYHSPYQQATYQMLGAKFEHDLDVIRSNQLKEREFDVIMLPCAGVKAAARALMVVLPNSRGHILPQDGEQCITKPPVMRMSKQVSIDDTFIDSLVSRLKYIMDKSGAQEGDSTQFIVDSLADAFKKPLTAPEVESLSQQDGEEPAVWGSRLNEFIRSKLDDLVLPTVEPAGESVVGGAPDQEEPASLSSGEEEDTDDESVKSTILSRGSDAAPPAVEDRGCGAMRLDISCLKKFPDWQVYLVKQSEYMRQKGLVFDVKNAKDGESFEDFITRVTSTDEVQKASISHIVSNNALRKQMQAMNMFIWPDSIQQKVSKRSREAFDYLLRFKKTEGAETNLFEALEGLKAYLDGTAPVWVAEMVTNMDTPKLNALESLKEMHGHIKFLPGVAASGKSTFLLTLIFLMFFGECGEEDPANCKPAEKQGLYSKCRMSMKGDYC
jgi:hypothetical protein